MTRPRRSSSAAAKGARRMKRLIDLVKANPKVVAILIGSVLLGVALVFGLRTAGSAINEHRIGQLETEKQEALKQVSDAHSEILILQGEVKAKAETIKK